LTQSDVAALAENVEVVADGNLELGLDILASTLVTGICMAASWAASGATMGVSVIMAPHFCAGVSFFAGIIFSTFSWIDGVFGTPSNDDAWWNVEAAGSHNAQGNSLGISYHRSGEVDRDSLGWIGRGQIKESREDLDAQHLTAIEVRVENTDDVCVKNMLFRIGKEPSGTGKVEELSIPGGVFAYVTRSRLHDSREMCIKFGDDEGAIGNFKFNWRSALKCQENYGAYLTIDFANCLRWAMYRYDVRRNGQYKRTTFWSQTLPSHHANPMTPIRSRGRSSLCMDIYRSQTANLTPVQLFRCTGNNNQRFHFDADGRLRSALNPTKCIEAGAAGTLYRKLFVFDCHNGLHQQWQRYSDGRIRNKGHGKYIGTAYCRRESGAQLELRWYEGGECGEAQKFSK